MLVKKHVQKKSRECETISDAELVHRFKMGDESAFSSIVLKYKERFVRIAQNILGDETEAMDISQDAFVKAYFSLKNFREDSSLYTWLYRILYNLCISALRRKKIISFISFEHREETREFVSSSTGPFEDFERKEFREAVANALKRLPERQRMVFVMKQAEGLKHEEIAQIIGITEGAVKASYFQAVKKLQNYLREYGDHYEM